MKNKHQFSDDNPIKTESEDLLRRSSFAKDLSKSIVGWKENESLVIAIYGAWGEGKSSLKNLIIEQVEKEAKTPTFIEFNPWQWSNEDNLSSAFFNETITVLQTDKSEKKKELVQLLKKYSKYLELSSELADKVREVIEKGLKAASGFVGLMSVFLENYRIPILIFAGVLYVFSQVASGIVWTLKLIKDWSEAGLSKDKPLNAQKENIKEKLRKLEDQIIIVIDDIDRLGRGEIRSLFTLIKANADFPNVVYLTFFQRDIVEKSLDDKNLKGEEYLKKIIQIGSNLPKVPDASVHKILFTKLDQSLSFTGLDKVFEQGRWNSLFHYGAKSYFKNLRDVNRFYSTFQFHLSLFQVDGSFEVNFVDYFGIEVLRNFEPAVYNNLPFLQPELTKGHSGSKFEDDENKVKKKIEDVLTLSTNKDAVISIIKELFPNISWIWNSGYRDIWDEDYQKLRINHPDRFNSYFGLQLDEGQVTQSELNNFLKATNDYSKMRTLILAAYKKNVLVDLLEAISNYKKKISKEDLGEFLKAMFFAGDLLKKSDDFFNNPMLTVERVIHWSFHERKIPFKQWIYLQAIEESEAVYLPLTLLFKEIMRGDEKKYPSHYIFPRFYSDELKELFKIKITNASSDNVFKNSDYLPRMISMWSSLDNIGAISWLQNYISTDEDFISFFVKMITRGSASSGTETKYNYYIGYNQLEDLFPDLSDIFARYKAIELDTKENTHNQLKEAFDRAEYLYLNPKERTTRIFDSYDEDE